MNWAPVYLKYISRFQYGDALPSDENLRNGPISVYGSNGPYAEFSEANTKAPVIIIGRKGSYGKINWSDQRVYASDTTFFVDSSSTKHHLRWLFYVLQALNLDEGSNEAAVPGLNRETAYQKRVLVPPKSIQRAIADYLDEKTAVIDHLITAKQRLLKLLDEKRRALITHAVTRGLDPTVPLCNSGVEWIGRVPEHWEIERLRRFVFNLEQGWSPRADDREPESDEWGVLKLNAVKNGKFDSTKAKSLKGVSNIPATLEVFPGDFLVTRANTPELVGDTCYVEETRPKLILSDLIYRLNIDIDALNGKYLNYFLQTPIARVQIETDARGSSASMVKIAQKHVLDWIVLLPPNREQIEIVEYLDRKIQKLDELEKALQKTIALLQERRTALIAAAVSGQHPVADQS